MRPSECIRRIREYREEHPELKRSHHFVFDLRLNRNAKKFRHMVIAINPGESEDQWDRCPTPTEESSEYNFHDKFGMSQGALDWQRQIFYYCGSLNVVLSEFFFWSSKNGEVFRELYGVPLKKSPHLPFCKEMNLHLVEYHKPEVVIAPGIGDANFFAELYELSPVSEKADPINGHRLISHFERDGRPWIFTKHWTGSHGFSGTQKEIVRSYIASLTM